MANTGFKGVDVLQTGGRIVFRASLKDTSGAKVTTGTTNVYLYEEQSDGTLNSFDWSNNTFTAGALGTETQVATHRKGNNNTTDTGVWTTVLTVLTGFTIGAKYIVVFSNLGASPPQQEKEFQFGSEQGDLTTTTPTAGVAYLNTNMPALVMRTGTCQVGSTSSTVVIDAGAVFINNFYDGSLIVITGGTGAGQARVMYNYDRTTNIASVDRIWETVPDGTSTFTILASDLPGVTFPNLTPPNNLAVMPVAYSKVLKYDPLSGAISNQDTTQVGSISTTIKLASTASSIDGFYVGQTVSVISGTATGQARIITGYIGSTRVATVDRAWTTTPGDSDGYVVFQTDQPGTDAFGNVMAHIANVAGQGGALATLLLGGGDAATPSLKVSNTVHLGIGALFTGNYAGARFAGNSVAAEGRGVAVDGYGTDDSIGIYANGTGVSVNADGQVLFGGGDASNPSLLVQNTVNGGVAAQFSAVSATNNAFLTLCDPNQASVYGYLEKSDHTVQGILRLGGLGFGALFTANGDAVHTNNTYIAIADTNGAIGVLSESDDGTTGYGWSVASNYPAIAGNGREKASEYLFQKNQGTGAYTRGDMLLNNMKVGGAWTVAGATTLTGAVTYSSTFTANGTEVPTTLAEVGVDVDELVAAIGGPVVLAANGLDAVLVESGITLGPSLVNDAGTQLSSINARQALALILGGPGLGGLISGAGTTNPIATGTGAGAGQLKNRASVTADGVGNRSAVNLVVPV